MAVYLVHSCTRNNDNNGHPSKNQINVVTPTFHDLDVVMSNLSDAQYQKNLSILRKNPGPLSSAPQANVTSADSNYLDGQYFVKFKYTMKDVLCVPSFKVSLLSVGKIIDGLNYSITFFPLRIFCKTWLRGRRLVLRSTVVTFITLFHWPPPPLPFTKNLPSSPHHLTRTLARAPKSLFFFPSSILASTFLNCSFDSGHVCEVCPLAKQTHHHLVLVIFQLWALFPFCIMTFGVLINIPILLGLIILSIVDDFSRVTGFFLCAINMKHKRPCKIFLLTVKHNSKRKSNKYK